MGWCWQFQPIILGMATKICNDNVLYSHLNSAVPSHYYSFSGDMEIWGWGLGMVKRQGSTFLKSILFHSLSRIRIRLPGHPTTGSPVFIWGSFGLPQAIPGLAPTQAKSPAPPAHPLPRRPSRMPMCAPSLVVPSGGVWLLQKCEDLPSSSDFGVICNHPESFQV